MDSRAVEERHPFRRTVLPPAGPAAAAAVDEGRPLPVRLRGGDGAPDIRTVERGLRGRAGAMAQRYEENVLRREVDSARLAARARRAAAAPELESEVERVREEGLERAAAVRREAGPRRMALRLRLAALDSRIRTGLREPPEDLAGERERTAGALRALEEETEARAASIERETGERIAALRTEFEERMARVEKEELQAAAARVREQTRRKQEDSGSALDEALAQLRALRPARSRAGHPADGAAAAPAPLPDLRKSREAVQRKVRDDARLAAELARETAGPGSSASQVARRAGWLLDGKL